VVDIIRIMMMKKIIGITILQGEEVDIEVGPITTVRRGEEEREEEREGDTEVESDMIEMRGAWGRGDGGGGVVVGKENDHHFDDNNNSIDEKERPLPTLILTSL